MQARLDLLLFPYAGSAGTMFREWLPLLPRWINPIPVTLPGRGMRYGERVATQWDDLIARLAGELSPSTSGNYAIFGHSLGALVGLELAHALREVTKREALWIGVSGCTAPAQRAFDDSWLSCSEEEMIEKVQALSGTPAELLESRELLELILPALRADFHLAGTYVGRSRAPLECAMLALAGRADEEVVVPAEKVSDWRGETTGAFRLEYIDGGHFFIDEHRHATVGRVVHDLSRIYARLVAHA